MDTLDQMLVGRDRTYSTVLFEYGERTVIADVAHDEHCVLPAVFASLRCAYSSASPRNVENGAGIEPTAGSPGPEPLKGAA